MKKILMLVLVVFLLGGPVLSPAYAGLFSDNSTNQDQDQVQGQAQGQIGINESSNRNTNTNLNSSSSRSSSNSTAVQGQAAIQGQASLQGNKQGVTIGGDTNDYEATALAYQPPALNPVKGMKESQINSIFGGLGFSQTEEYSTCSESIKLTMDALRAGIISPEEAKAEYLEAKAQYKDSTRPKRLLGIFWKTRGQHVGNLLGFAATDPCGWNIDNGFGLGLIGKDKEE